MKITNFEVFPITIPLKTPFIISSGTQNDYFGVLLKLTTEDGIDGWGEAAPSARVTGETPESVQKVLNNKIKPLLLARDAEELENIMEAVEETIPNQPSTCCAVDIALHDLLGKNAQVPIKNLLGGYRDSIPISFTVVIGTVEESIQSAQKYIDMGAKVLKVKLGVDPNEDLARLKALREAFGYEIMITADANQGYSVNQAINTLNKIARYDIEFVEQPVVADNLEGLKKVHNAVDVPIMADECACSVDDVKRLIKLELVDMVNIKLMKCGGLRNAAQISNLTEAAGIPCQIGCMIETGVSITAGTHLALALKNIKYADLDGHIFLKHDVVTNHQITKNGMNTITGSPGLGIEIDFSNYMK